MLTTKQQIEQQGFVIGYLASYATEYAAEAALETHDEELKAYLLEKTPCTPFPELLQKCLQKGVEEAVVQLLRKKSIAPESISKAIGWNIKDKRVSSQSNASVPNPL